MPKCRRQRSRLESPVTCPPFVLCHATFCLIFVPKCAVPPRLFRPGLNKPFTLKTTLKERSVKHITLKGPSCSFDYRKCGDAVEVFIGNYDKNAYQDKPAQFEIVLYFADPAD